MKGGKARTLVAASALIGVALALAPSAGATGFRSTFNAGAEGWQDGTDGGPADFSPVAGHPGGHISDSFPGGGFASVGSPVAWSGDRSTAFGGVLSFDLRLDAGNTGTALARIVCDACAAGSLDDINYAFSTQATDEWQRFRVALRPSGWTDGTPAPATQFGFIQALEDLLTVKLSVSEIDTDDVAYFDNVTFAANVKRSLTIKHGGTKFSGKLSPSGGCAKRQAVVVYRRKAGSDAKVGDDKTNPQGEYSVREPNAQDGSYYAKAKPSFANGTGNCRAAKSKSERVG